MLVEGEAVFKKRQFRDALLKFRGSRKLNPALIPPWIYEIRILSGFRLKEELRKTVQSFVSEHPAMRNLPIIKRVLQTTQ